MTEPVEPGDTKEAKHRRACVRVYHLSQEGMTPRAIANQLGIDESKVGEMIKTGRRFAP